MASENYIECKRLLKSFKKKDYWKYFSSADTFLFYLGKKKSLFTFVEQFYNDSFGCQLFFNNKGFNYVHDILSTSKENLITICDCDSICAIFAPKSDLKDEEIAYLKKNKIKIMENDNLLIYRFEAGLKERIANVKEIEILLTNLYYLNSIIPQEFNDIIEAFKKNDSVVCFMDEKRLEYSVIYRPLPYLECKIKKEKPNIQFVEEFKNSTYLNDECFFSASYLPVIIKDKNIRPLIISFYYTKSNRNYFKYLITTPNEYKNCIFGILYDVFTDVGMPYKIIFNNRYFHAIVENTLNELNIENYFERETYVMDNEVSEVLEKIGIDNNTPLDEEITKSTLDSLFDTINEFETTNDEIIDITDEHFVS